MPDLLDVAQSNTAVIEIVRAMRLLSDAQAANVLLSCVQEALTQQALVQQEASVQGLTPGRVVHYVAYGTPGGEFPAGAHRAAIITRLDNVGLGQWDVKPEVSLCVLNPTGMFFDEHIPFDSDPDPKPGTWHWIEPA